MELVDYGTYVSDEKFAQGVLLRARWPDGVRCQFCGSSRIHNIGTDYRCSDCRGHFSKTSGTLFAQSHLTASQWIIALANYKELFANGYYWQYGLRSVYRPPGTSVSPRLIQLSIGCHYRTARRLCVMFTTMDKINDPFVRRLTDNIVVVHLYFALDPFINGEHSRTWLLRTEDGKACVVPFATREAVERAANKPVTLERLLKKRVY